MSEKAPQATFSNGLDAPQMLAIELHAVGAPVLVDFEAVREVRARARAQLRILRGAADVTEGNAIDRPPPARHPAPFPHLQPHMPAPDNTTPPDPPLPPPTPPAQT